MADNFKILLQASLDAKNSLSNINNNIDNLKDQIKHIELNAKLNEGSLKTIKDQLNSISTDLIEFDIDPKSKSNLERQGQEAGQDFSYAFGKAANLKLSINDDEIITKTKTVINQMDALKHRAEKSGIQLGADNLQKFDDLSGMVDNLKDVKQLREYLALARSEYQRLNALMSADIPDSAIEKMNANISKMPDNISKVGVGLEKLREPSVRLSAEVENLAVDYQKLAQFDDADDIDKKIELYNKLTENMSRLRTEISAVSQVERLQPQPFQRKQLDFKIKNWMNDNTRAAKHFNKELGEMLVRLESADAQGVKDIGREFSTLTKHADATNLSGKTMFETLKNNAQKFTSWFGISQAVMAGTRAIKDMVNQVRELDDSLVELRKVSDLTGSSLYEFVDRAYKLGETVARTGKDVIDATTIFKRAGYTIEESLDLAEASLVMMNVGDGINSVDEASSSLIATLKGFKMSDTDAMSVIDMINETSNTAAIDFDNITEGLKRVSGTLSQTGTSIQETIGLLTGGFGSLRNIEVVSSGILMFSQRLRGISDTGEEIEGLAPKIQKEFKEIANIDIEDSQGNLRNTYDILEDMARIFPTLTDKQRQYLGELAAGNRQVKVLNAIIEGWEDVESAVDSATNSQGSALDENEKVLDSVTGRINAFRSAFEQLSQTTISSEWMKFFIELGTKALKAVDAVGGLIPVLTALSILYFSFNKKHQLLWLQNFISKLVTTTTVAGATKVAIGGLTISLQALTATLTFGLALAIPLIVTGIQKLSKASEEAIQASKDLKDEFESTEKTFKSNKDVLISLEDEFKALSRGVDKYGKNVSLSTEEYERYKDIISQIVDISSKVAEGYDKEGDAIVNKNSLIERSIELLKEERRQALLSQTTDENNLIIAQGVTGTYNQYLKQAEDSRADVAYEVLTTISKVVADTNQAMTDEMYNAFLDAFGLNTENILAEAAMYQSSTHDNMGTLNALLTHSADAQDKVVESLLGNFQAIEQLTGDISLTNISSQLDQYTNNMNNAEASTKGFNSQLQLVAESNPIYDDLTDAQQNFISQYIDSFKLAGDETNRELEVVISDAANHVRDFVNLVSNNDVAKIRIDELFDLQFNKGGIPVDEFISQYKDLVEQIIDALKGADGKGLTEEEEVNIRIKLEPQIEGVENLHAQVQEEIDKLELDKLELQKTLDYVATLDIEDLQVFYEILSDPDSEYKTFQDFLNALEAAKAKAEEEDITVEVAFEGMSDSLSGIEKLKSSIADVATEMENTGTIGVDSINKLISAYPQLSDVLHGYINGLYTEQDVLNALSEQYEQDVQNYQNAIIAKYDTDKDFYSKLYSNNTSAIRDFANNYDLDYKNWHNLAQAKLDIDNKLIRELSKGWAGYFNVVKNAAGSYQVELEGRPSINSAADAKRFYQAQGKAQSAANQANEALKELNKLSGISLSLPSAGSIISNSIKKAQDKSGSSNRSSAAKEAQDNTDYHLEAFKTLLAELQYNRDKDVISEKQYYDSLNTLNNKYFKGKSEYLDQYRQYEVEVYKGLKQIEEQRQQELRQAVDDRISNSKEWIDARNFYNDWGSDHEIDSWERVRAYLKDYYNKGIISHREYVNYLLEIDKSLLSAREKMFNEVKNLVEKEQSLAEKDLELRQRNAQEKLDISKKMMEDTVSQRQLEIDALQEEIDEINELESKKREDKERSDRLKEISDLSSKYYYLQGDNIANLTEAQAKLVGLEKEREQYLERQTKLQELQIKLENVRSQQNIQQLKKLEDGTFEFEYVADQKEIDSVNKELKDLQKTHDKTITELRENTLEQLKDKQESYDEWERQNDLNKLIKKKQARIKEYRDEIKSLQDKYKELEKVTNKAFETEKENLNRYYSDIDALTDEKLKDLKKTYGDNWSQISDVVTSHFDDISIAYDALVAKLSQPLPTQAVSGDSDNTGASDDTGDSDGSGAKDYGLGDSDVPTAEENRTALEKLTNDPSFVASEKERAKEIIKNREEAGMDATRQKKYLESLDRFHEGGIVGSPNSSRELPKLVNEMFNTKPNERIVKALEGELFVPQENLYKNFLPNMQELLKSTTLFKMESNIPKLPNIPSATSSGSSGQVFNISKLEFPNVKDAKEIEGAIRNLSTYAGQWANKRK